MILDAFEHFMVWLGMRCSYQSETNGIPRGPRSPITATACGLSCWRSPELISSRRCFLAPSALSHQWWIDPLGIPRFKIGQGKGRKDENKKNALFAGDGFEMLHH
jgi:hypothetical protein